MLERDRLKVLLLTTHPHPEGACERLLELARKDRFGLHELTNDPAEADLILFVQSIGIEMFLNQMRRHVYTRRFPQKCFCFCEADHQVSFLPGIYTSVQKRWYSRSRERGGFYLAMYDNPFVTYVPERAKPEYLFSFVGDSQTNANRRTILQLQHPRAKLIDTSDYCWTVRHEGSADQQRAFAEDYAEIVRGSSFVLCPRGWSPSSVRLFETLKMGRVPVIISDQWVPPEGPDWSLCSVSVPEADIGKIPALLESLEPKAEEMGEAGRQIYLEWFAEEVRFHRIVEWCREIDAVRSPLARRFASHIPVKQIIQIGRVRLFLIDILRSIRNAFISEKKHVLNPAADALP